MILKSITLLDIYKIEDNKRYEYLYGVNCKRFLFIDVRYAIRFQSNLPHWWWSEIQKQMLRSGFYFEDLLESGLLDIGMGVLFIRPFGAEEEKAYGKGNWEFLCDEAVVMQQELVTEYELQHGSVNLSKYSLFAN
ncbi:MAG: hypothetical protein R8L07_11000 [Alphaproteobacteria bacterium]|nr:hypothetical protein [Alphaproteobacteria bacterium]